MKRIAATSFKFFVFGLAACFLFRIFVPISCRSREYPRRVSCQSNLKNLALSIKEYSKDYDEKLPPLSSGGKTFGWADALSDYTRSREIFHCPSSTHDANGSDPKTGNFTDYAFNARLARMQTSKLDHPFSSVLLAEGNDGKDLSNARYSLSTLPPSWIADENSPAFRHLTGANYAFADGHVKWLKPNRIKEVRPNGKNYTFAVR